MTGVVRNFLGECGDLKVVSGLRFMEVRLGTVKMFVWGRGTSADLVRARKEEEDPLIAEEGGRGAHASQSTNIDSTSAISYSACPTRT